MKKKNSILVIAFLVLIVSVPTYASFLKGDRPGTTPDNPYLIYSEEDLRKIGNDPEWSLDKHYKLMVNIELEKPKNGQSNWTSIGSDDNPFTGTFDGNNKTIAGITILNSTTKSIGFFETIEGKKCRIENLGLLNIEINCEEIITIGGLVVKNNGSTIKSCYVLGNITAKEGTVGGLVYRNNGTIIDCYFSGNITGGKGVGGLVNTNCGIIKNCYSNSNISDVSSIAGGLVCTMISLSNSQAIVQNSYFIGQIYGYFYAGGLIGSMYSGVIRDCFSISHVEGGESTGGIAGDVFGETLIERCYFIGGLNYNGKFKSTGIYSLGGIAGGIDINKIIIKDCLVIMNSPSISTSQLRYGYIAGGDNTSYGLKNNIYDNKIINRNYTTSSTYEIMGWDFTSSNPVWEFNDEYILPKLVGVKGQESLVIPESLTY